MVDLKHLTEVTGLIVDATGVTIIVVGALISSIIFLINFKKTSAYKKYRETLGKVILLGLEFLIAGDIIRSVVVTPTFTSVGILGLIVIIRSILSIELEMEITGRWPWQSKNKE